MYLSWSDIYSSFLFHCWELLTHVHLMELFSMGLRYQFLSTPPVILLITRGTQLFFVGRDVCKWGHLYFGVDIILVKHHVNQQWVQTGWLVPSWAELTTIFPSMAVLFVFDQKWERPEQRSSPSSGTIGQFQVTVFSRFCYVLLCNHEYIHCLNHDRQAKDYITRRNETERKL